MRIKLKPCSIANKLFIPIAKNAHRSIVTAIINNGGKKEYWNALPNLPKVVLLREPIARAYSAYRMFFKDGDVDLDFDSFMLAMLKGKRINRVRIGDLHLLTQWESIGKVEPNIVVKWDFDQLAKILGLPIIPHLGEGIPNLGESLSQETQKLFDDHYSIDIEMWYGRS